MGVAFTCNTLNTQTPHIAMRLIRSSLLLWVCVLALSFACIWQIRSSMVARTEGLRALEELWKSYLSMVASTESVRALQERVAVLERCSKRHMEDYATQKYCGLEPQLWWTDDCDTRIYEDRPTHCPLPVGL